MNLKKKLSLLCNFLLIFLFAGCLKTSIYGETYTLNILEFNDLHGHIEKINNQGGISNASYLINKIRNEDDYDNTLLLANGDIFQETAISRVNYGRVLIDIMNEMRFDAMTLGNHEFDWGIDKILAYWDGDLNNGEANFPLLNANIYDNNTNSLVQLESNNILSSTIINKGPINIGVIGYIGNVYNSINRNMVENYTFKASDEDIMASVLDVGATLKDNGADIIVVSIHDGDADGITNYNLNNLLAELKYNDKYLVNAVLNGHTHTEQGGLIARKDDVGMPVIQSSPYISSTGAAKEFGRIDLEINLKTNSIVSADTSHVSISTAKINFDQSVEKIVQDYKEASKDVLEEIYCQNLKTIGRYDTKLQNWICNLMMAGSEANAGLFNNGGLRSGVSIGNFGFNEVYSLNPFDNHIILVEITGANLQSFLKLNPNHYFCYTSSGEIDTSKTYKLAIIDYVYYSNYFTNYRNDKAVDTNLIVRDLIIEELRYYKYDGFNIYENYNTIHISKYI
ncbi:MAG: bifunctional metallophosphatase/5'-nucleotidase [Anaeroplasma sp.]